jgi:phosphoribosylformylglycinamidine cyclo-ligase
VLPIFKLLQENGGVADNEAYRVFNMGIGMVLIVDPAFVPTVHKTAAEAGVKSYLIGEIRKGKPEVRME